MISERDNAIGTSPAPGWMIVECEENRLWLESQHSFTAFELDSSRPHAHAAELLAELNGATASNGGRA